MIDLDMINICGVIWDCLHEIERC